MRYDKIEEFNMDSKAECGLAHVARNKSQADARIAFRTASQQTI